MKPIRHWQRPHSYLVALLLIVFAGCATDGGNRQTLMQYSTINALLAGVYDGDFTFGQLKQHGDFGLGTFNALDGEMVALDGIFYQVKTDGTVVPVADATLTPFATVTFFKPNFSLALTNSLDFHGIEQALDQALPDKNAFYAIRIEGEFVSVKARSVPRQQRPYPTLLEAAKRESIFEFHNVRGTLVGFRVPEYAGNLNVPGYHFHFLTTDHHAGGHVLACRIQNGNAEIDRTTRFLMILPQHGAFAETDIAKPRNEEIGTVEKSEP